MNTPTPTAAPVAKPVLTPEQRNEQIVTAVNMLDRTIDAHWTKQDGLPDLNAVSELTGFRVTRAEVNAVADGFVRNPAPAPVGGAPTPTAAPQAPVAPAAPEAPVGDAFRDGDNGLNEVTATTDAGNDAQSGATPTPSAPAGGDTSSEAPAPTAKPDETPVAPKPTPKPAAPVAKAASGAVADEVIKVKNLTQFLYTIAEFRLEPDQVVEINLSLLDSKTRAKIEHGIKVGSFAKV